MSSRRSTEDGSEDSNFSGAAHAARAAGKGSRKNRKKKSNGLDTFDDNDFTLVERSEDRIPKKKMSGDTGGGVLGMDINLTRSLDTMQEPRGGGGKRKKNQQQVRAKPAASAPRRGQQNSRQSSSSSYLDQADDIQRGGGFSAARTRSARSNSIPALARYSLTSTPTAPDHREKNLEKTKTGGSSSEGGPGGWISTLGSQQEECLPLPSASALGSLGRVGARRDRPSTKTARKKQRNGRATKPSTRADTSQEHEVVDISFSDEEEDNGSSPVRPTKRTKADNSDRDEVIEHSPAGDKSPGSGGVDWGMGESGRDEESGSDEESEDFIPSASSTSSKNRRSPSSDVEHSQPSGYSLKKAATSAVTSAASMAGRAVKGASKLFNASASKKRKAGSSRILPGASLGLQGSYTVNDDIEDFESTSDSPNVGGRNKSVNSNLYEELVKDQTTRDQRSSLAHNDSNQSAKKSHGTSRTGTTSGKSHGINPSSFHGKSGASSSKETRVKSKNNSTARSYAPRRPRRSARNKKRTNEVIHIDDDSSQEDEFEPSEDQYRDEDADVEQAIQNSLEDKEETPVRRMANRVKVGAVRIAIGKRVFSHGCELSFQPGTKHPFVRLSFRNEPKDGASSSTSTKEKPQVFTISPDSIEEMKYFLAEKNEEAELDSSTHAEVSLGVDATSFLAMRVEPTDRNGLDKFSNSYLQTLDEVQEKDLALKKYIVVELRSDDEFEANMLEYMRKNLALGAFLTEDAELTPRQAKTFTAALVEDDKKDKKSRTASPKKRKTRSSTRAADAKASSEENKTVLVYPFEAEPQVFDDACKDLTEVGGKIILGRSEDDGTNEWGNPPEEELLSSSSSAAASASAGAVASDDDPTASSAASAAPSGRTHYLTIRNDDMDRLEAGEFLNDTLIDFFMRWIWRKEDPDASSVHFFTSHFFSTLDDEGPASVSSWTAKKNIDIFTKRFVFIPINESLHWSLCVVVNPGHILNEYANEEDQSDDQEFPCILFLDSLKAHRKNRVANKVRKWLNYEAKRLKKFEKSEKSKLEGLFNKNTMEVFDPKIPYQDNSWDCGVFVCRYAYALYLMRDNRLTYESAGTSEEPSPYFRNLITDSDEFNFGMPDIANVRDEMKTLIQNLSKVYLEMKRKEQAERKERKKRKKDERKAEEEEEKKKKEAAAAVAAAAVKCEEEDDSEEKKASETGADGEEEKKESETNTGLDGVLV